MSSLEEQLGKILSKHFHYTFTEDDYKEPLVQEFVDLVTQQLIAARKEQIMQDFISLVDLPERFDEADLIEWRQDRINELAKGEESNG